MNSYALCKSLLITCNVKVTATATNITINHQYGITHFA